MQDVNNKEYQQLFLLKYVNEDYVLQCLYFFFIYYEFKALNKNVS